MEKIIEISNNKIWHENKFQDVSFSFPESEDGKVLHANKTILAEVSPVFEAMFFGELAEKRSPIPIVDVEPEIFEAFLKFIYTSEFPGESLEDVQKLFMVANKYEVIAIEEYCEKHLIHNITKFDLDSLILFADMFSLNNLLKLSRFYKNQNPCISGPPKWVHWKQGDPLPSDIFIADYDTDGWPLGIGRFPGDPKAGTLYIREMKLRRGWMASVVNRHDDFEILCAGDLVWIRSDNPLTSLQREERLMIGKVLEEGKAYIGDIEGYPDCVQIGYDIGSARIDKNFYELADKKIGTVLGSTYIESRPYNEIRVNLKSCIEQRKATFLGQERFSDLNLAFSDSKNFLHVNRVILAQVSSIFFEMDAQDEIMVNDFDFNTFEAFIRYIYTQKFSVKTLQEAEKYLEIGSKYQVFCIQKDCEAFLMKHLTDFATSEVFDFAKKHKMDELLKLSTLVICNNPCIDKRYSWVNWKRGDTLPTSTFIADFDKSGWPIGIARSTSLKASPGPLFIKTMTAKNGICAIAHENSDEFDILCDGDLEWVPSSVGKKIARSVTSDYIGIGKTEIDGEVYIGKVEPGYFFIPYKSGEAVIGEYLQLIHKFN